MTGATPDFNIWEDFVDQYSRRQITYQSDLLPATSGVVNVMRSRNVGNYVSGLWRNHFLPGLLWHVSFSASRSKAYPKPTWSWVSIDGAIQHVGIMSTYGESADRLHTRYDSRLERIDCGNVLLDPTTHVYAASVTISGPSITAKFTSRPPDSVRSVETFWLEVFGQEHELKPDVPLSDDEKASISAVSCLRVKTESRDLEQYGYTDQVSSLVLRTSKTEDSEFERLGLLMQYCHDRPERSRRDEWWSGAIEKTFIIH